MLAIRLVRPDPADPLSSVEIGEAPSGPVPAGWVTVTLSAASSTAVETPSGAGPANEAESTDAAQITMHSHDQRIVTLMFTGPGHKLANGPTVHSLVSDTVLELWPGATVTGVARGGFD